MNDSGNVTEQRQQDIDKKVLAKTDLEKHPDRRQNDCQDNLDNIAHYARAS